jgi:hypothetical protein
MRVVAEDDGGEEFPRVPSGVVEVVIDGDDDEGAAGAERRRLVAILSWPMIVD